MEWVLLLLICFLFLSQPNNCSSSRSFNSTTSLCHSHQSSALLHFRNSFSVGDSNGICDYFAYPPKNSWKMGTDCCGWDGVTCDTMTGHVIGLDLTCSRLEGPIHPNSTLFSLRHLQRLNLAYNNIYGSISSKFGGFANMTHLNLTESSVAGHMPPSLGNLSNLEWLDLSSNMLTGEIPGQLADITYLEVLNLSENRLVGMIPRGNQFNTFENVSYLGNLGLCGFPLTRTCGNVDGQQQPLPSLTFHDDDFEFGNWFHWKVVLLGYGCGFMFGLGLGYLVLSSEKPKWLVNIVYGEQRNMLQRSKKNAR